MSRINARIGLCLISLLVNSTAFAQNNRSAVSVNGSDGNTCTTISPCRSFVVALAHTNAGGEVIALDSGGYGAFSISQSVSVIGAPGAHAALTTSVGDGIDVAAGSTDSIKIRGLNITLTSSSGTGISAMIFGALSIENCSVNGGQDGIVIAGVAGSNATLVDTAVRGASSVGYIIQSPAALVRCRAEKNGSTGLNVTRGVGADGIVSAVDFVSVGNGFGASVISNLAGHKAFLNLDHFLAGNNASDGILAVSLSGGAAAARVTNSTVADNGGYGFNQAGTATFISMMNNLVAGNGLGDATGTITPATVH